MINWKKKYKKNLSILILRKKNKIMRDFKKWMMMIGQNKESKQMKNKRIKENAKIKQNPKMLAICSNKINQQLKK